MFLDNPLYTAPKGVKTRWASGENPDAKVGFGGMTNDGRKGAAWAPLKAGDSVVLAHAEETTGIIRRIWITINDRSAKFLRGVKIEFFWDGDTKPAVSAPIGDFFGHCIGRMCKFDSALFSSPEARSFNCTIPMPFKKSFKVVLTNETDANVDMLFYDVDFTIGDTLPEDTLYFHAHYRRERETVYKQDYKILPTVYGRGRFLGVNFGVIANQKLYFNSWWGEGEMKMYIDGDTDYPTLCGTGTEDYIGDAWSQWEFSNMYQGCPIADPDKMEFAFYRYHIADPVYFEKDIRCEMFQIGCWYPEHKEQFKSLGKPVYYALDGYHEVDWDNTTDFGIYEREKDDWSSCAFFYLDKTSSNLCEIDCYEDRIAGLVEEKNTDSDFMKIEK